MTLIPMLFAKLHRATVTEANLEYEGSVTIDSDLLDAAAIPEFAKVEIYNCTNGNRLATYTIRGVAGSGVVCINGAAAHLCHEGDVVIICFYGLVNQDEVSQHTPRILLLEKGNRIKKAIGK